jgi:hypothetical protein
MIDDTRMDQLKEEREFWDLYREVMAEKGVDISSFYADAARRVKQDFSMPRGFCGVMHLGLFA